jgi:hypothetical protein
MSQSEEIEALERRLWGSADTLRSTSNYVKLLESRVGVAVRFMTAAQLPTLRQQLPGPLPVGVFCDGVLQSGSILDDGFIERLVSSHAAQQSVGGGRNLHRFGGPKLHTR